MKTALPNAESHEKQFLRIAAMLLLVCIGIAVVFAGLSTANHQPPFDKLALDGQTLASYVAIVLGTTVAGAGSWVAIQIAQAAYVAQQTANRLQQDELRLQDPDETGARTFIARSRALRLTGISAVARSRHANRHWQVAAGNEMSKLVQRDGITSFKDPKVNALEGEAAKAANAKMKPVFAELTAWLQADMAKEMNALTPLILIHSMGEKSPEGNSVAQGWLAASNSLALGLSAMNEMDLGEGIGHLESGCKAIESILADPRLGDHKYALDLVQSTSTDGLQKLKTDLGYTPEVATDNSIPVQ